VVRQSGVTRSGAGVSASASVAVQGADVSCAVLAVLKEQKLSFSQTAARQSLSTKVLDSSNRHDGGYTMVEAAKQRPGLR
jgi:hypothetical protein